MLSQVKEKEMICEDALESLLWKLISIRTHRVFPISSTGHSLTKPFYSFSIVCGHFVPPQNNLSLHL